MRILLGSISVLPTHVGVIPCRRITASHHACTTHTRGGDPRFLFKPDSTDGYYPHTWG